MHVLFIVREVMVACIIPTTKISPQMSFPFNLDRTEAFSTGNNSYKFHWNLVVLTFAGVTSAAMGCWIFLLSCTFC